MARNRFIACTLLLTLLLGIGALPSSGLTRVRHALLERHETAQRVQEVRQEQARLKASLRKRIAAMERTTVARFLTGSHGRDERRSVILNTAQRLLVIARSRLRALSPRTRERLRALHIRYQNLQRWLDEVAILRACPVPDFIEIVDNFGVTVRIKHVPVHIHQGNDIPAPSGAPILAPFDGFASAGHDKLGGLTVRVYGAQGYAYNAHLSSYGQLGWVSAGDVIGYVGSTGDATGPHNHFEWHPGDGPAVDPHELLLTACASVTSP